MSVPVVWLVVAAPPGSSVVRAEMKTSGQLWRVAGIIVSQTAVLTAVLFYFGWARTTTTFEYFGVDVSLLGFSTSDYLLRSANSAFHPLLVAGVAVIVATGAHQGLLAAAQRGGDRSPRSVRHVPLAALALGVVLVAIALSGVTLANVGRKLGVGLPLCLGAGLALLAYAEHGWPRFRDGKATATPHPARQLRLFVLVGLALMALFWTVSLYAGQIGWQRAQQIARGLASATEVVIYAQDRLMLAGPGVQVADIPLADTKYRYRYSGLRLLVRGQERYVLVPVGWSRGQASAYILRDEDDIRLEFTAR